MPQELFVGDESAVPPGMSLRDIRTYVSADSRSAEIAETLIKSHGISLGGGSDQQLVSVDVCWRIFLEHAAAVDDETHCIFGTRCRPGTATLLVARMMVCETIFDAMQAYAEAAAVVIPDVSVIVTRRGDNVSLRWCSKRGNSELHHIAFEGMAIIYYAIFRWLAGGALPVQRVRAPATRRTSGSTMLELLAAPVVYNAQDLELFFSPGVTKARVMQRDIRGWQDGVYKWLNSAALCGRACTQWGSFTKEVRSALVQGADQRELAQQFGVSIKTVARRLEQEGCSFRRVRDEIRMQRCSSLIHTDLTIEEIADLIGYEDTRSFRRAFRRWFGMCPSAFRGRYSQS